MMARAKLGTGRPILKVVPLLNNSGTMGKSQMFWTVVSYSYKRTRKIDCKVAPSKNVHDPNSY